MDVLLFDDDPAILALVSTILEDLGFTSERFPDGEGALGRIQQFNPKLVILDIMMPGIDGLTICRALKADPATAGIKVVIISVKKYLEDRYNAKQVGADAFISKPFDVPQLEAVLRNFLGAGSPVGIAAATRPAAFRARVWGSRGPGGADSSLMFTSCVSLEFGQRFVILDAGSGLQLLNKSLKIKGKEVWILLTHYHEDHICGLPEVERLVAAGCRVSIAGPPALGRTLPEILKQMMPGVPPHNYKSFTLTERRYQLWPDVTAFSMMTNHPGTTVCFRIVHQGRSLVYCPDNELKFDEDAPTDFFDKVRKFVRTADVLIHDARYSNDEIESHRDQGHSSPAQVVKMAAGEGVRRLVLFHLDAEYTLVDLQSILLQAKQDLSTGLASMQIELAVPGMEIPV